MSELERQILVFDQTNDKVLAAFDFEADAQKFATDHAERNIGVTVVIFEPKEAFRAAARVSKVFLEYPTRNDNADKMREEPPAPPSPFGTIEY